MDNNFQIYIENFIPEEQIIIFLTQSFKNNTVMHLEAVGEYNKETIFYQLCYEEKGFRTQLQLVVTNELKGREKMIPFLKSLSEKFQSKVLFDLGYPDWYYYLIKNESLFFVYLEDSIDDSVNYIKDSLIEVNEQLLLEGYYDQL
ncbi:hypothetical protein [Flammeovirga sp. OC4]|uniref:hypothetical protein n=1 Tax=Flammeovirga sp. OC4 TaxID=1382345 RepID=UPI0005C7A35C|nr:hypothetical protein [Flammeovirga sp. OC4]